MSLAFNPTTGGLDLIKPDNFSISEVTVYTRIPEYQQMVVYDEIAINDTLDIVGELIVFNIKRELNLLNTSTSETIDVRSLDLIRQTSSGITTSFSNAISGTKITITNRSSGKNTLNITIQGNASPDIKPSESFSLIYNGTDFDFT